MRSRGTLTEAGHGQERQFAGSRIGRNAQFVQVTDASQNEKRLGRCPQGRATGRSVTVYTSARIKQKNFWQNVFRIRGGKWCIVTPNSSKMSYSYARSTSYHL